MVCSICKKNTAIVFTNKIVNGKQELEGLCFNCAKERGDGRNGLCGQILSVLTEAHELLL